MISKELELMLGAAAREAHIRHHEYLSIEHLLYAIMHHKEGAGLFPHAEVTWSSSRPS